MSNKHPSGAPGSHDGGLGEGVPKPPSDLERNPGIGTSKGVSGIGADPEELEADSTSEGDVMNETTREGGVDPAHTGRTNK